MLKRLRTWLNKIFIWDAILLETNVEDLPQFMVQLWRDGVVKEEQYNTYYRACKRADSCIDTYDTACVFAMKDISCGPIYMTGKHIKQEDWENGKPITKPIQDASPNKSMFLFEVEFVSGDVRNTHKYQDYDLARIAANVAVEFGGIDRAVVWSLNDCGGDLVYETKAQKKTEDPEWYDGSPTTKERIADLRRKLGIARGMLYEVKNEITDRTRNGTAMSLHLDELNKAIDESAD